MKSSVNTKKSLGFWMLLSLVVGNVIGAGIFLLPATLAHYGSISLIGWCITLVGSLCIAFVFSDLNKKIPYTGGPFLYTREAFGDLWGFAIAYTYWVAWCVGNASMALMIPGYLSMFFPVLKTHSVQPWLNFFIEAVFVWLVTSINLCGINTAGKTQVITTVLKVLPLLLIGIFGLFNIHWHYITTNFIATSATTTNSSHPLLGAMAVTLWAFVGIESSTIPAGDAVSSRAISKATIIGTLVVGLIYILCTFSLMGIIPAHQLKQSTSPFADAAVFLFGPDTAKLVALCALISIVGALNGSILVQTLDSVAAARFNLAPKFFTYLNKKNVSYLAFITAGIAITALLAFSMQKSLINQFNFIILISTLAFLIPYLACCLAEIVMLIKNRDQYTKRARTITLFITCLATIYSSWTIIGAGKKILIYGSIFFLTSFPLYALLFWIKRRKTENFVVE